MGHFHEHATAICGSDEESLAKGIEERSVEQLKAILTEWRGWMDGIGSGDGEVVRALQDGLGVNRVFRNAVEARAFMTNVHDRILVAVRERAGNRWNA